MRTSALRAAIFADVVRQLLSFGMLCLSRRSWFASLGRPPSYSLFLTAPLQLVMQDEHAIERVGCVSGLHVALNALFACRDVPFACKQHSTSRLCSCARAGQCLFGRTSPIHYNLRWRELHFATTEQMEPFATFINLV